MDKKTLIQEAIKNIQEEAAWKALDMENNGGSYFHDDNMKDEGWLAGMKNAVTILEDMLEDKSDEHEQVFAA